MTLTGIQGYSIHTDAHLSLVQRYGGRIRQGPALHSADGEVQISEQGLSLVFYASCELMKRRHCITDYSNDIASVVIDCGICGRYEPLIAKGVANENRREILQIGLLVGSPLCLLLRWSDLVYFIEGQHKSYLKVNEKNKDVEM